MIPTIHAGAHALPTPGPDAKESQLREAARGLEAAFLAEMLKSAGLNKSGGAFGGGAGEEHFASFLTEAEAKAMVETGGIGLAESIFNALKGRGDGTHNL